MTTIILRFFKDPLVVQAVNPESVEDNTEPCTDIVLSFDDAGAFVTAQLVKRNEEQTSDESETELVG